MRFSIWAAVSTIAQAEGDKASLPEQEARCRQAGASRGWVESAGPYIVPGESRTKWVNLRDAEEEIPALRLCLQDAKQRRFDLLILYDYNRLRDLLDPVAKTLASYGVQVFSVSQPVEPIPPSDFHPYASDSESMMRGMSQIISRWQLADLRRKYLYGVAARVRDGLPGLHIPYGYRKPAGQEMDTRAVPILIPEEARVIKEIRRQFLAGTPVLTIATRLNEQGIASPRGARWSASTILLVVLNPFYAGRVSFQRYKTIRDPSSTRRAKTVKNPEPSVWAEGKHPPVWSWDEHLEILAEYERRRSLPKNKQHAFSGLLVCSVCGSRMMHDRGKWKCKQKSDGALHSIMTLEESLAIIPRVLQKAFHNLTPISQEGEGEILLADVSDLERQRKRVQAAYESEVYTLEEAEAKIRAIDAKIRERKDLEAERQRRQKEREVFQRSIGEAREILEILPAWVRGEDAKTVNYFLARLVREIVVSPEGEVRVCLRGE